MIVFSRPLSRGVTKKLLQNWKICTHQPIKNHGGSRELERKTIGNREIVGYGCRGEPCYVDRTDFPFSAIRYKETTAPIEALREKEKGDWRKLSLSERKDLYRSSYCLTFAELLAPTGQWKGVIGMVLFWIGLGIYFYVFVHNKLLYRNIDIGPSFEHESVYAQMRRHINVQNNPITGLASKWDYENNKWKSQPSGYEDPFEVGKQYEEQNKSEAEEKKP